MADPSCTGHQADLATERESHLTTGRSAERTKLDFRCPICRSAIHFDLRAPSSTDVPFSVAESVDYREYPPPPPTTTPPRHTHTHTRRELYQTVSTVYFTLGISRTVRSQSPRRGRGDYSPIFTSPNATIVLV